jgi:hypothetical protein
MSTDLVTEQPHWSAEPPRPRRGLQALAIAVVLALLFAGGFALVRWVIDPNGSTMQPQRSAAPSPPKDAAASVLPSVVLQQTDAARGNTVQLLPRGDRVVGQATLDLCNGTFPSEAHRTARLQDALVDAQGNEVLSTEAVLYASPSFTTQGFAELRSVVSKCPGSPVRSPVGEPTVTTRFGPAPDGSWAQTPTVERQAYSFTTTDQAGRSAPGLAVYLRRGRALVGIYFAQPASAPPTVGGQSSVDAIVTLFATRLARLPASVVGGP